MKQKRSLLLSTLGIISGIILWISGAYCWMSWIADRPRWYPEGVQYTAGYYVSLGLVLSGAFVVFIALRASQFMPSVNPRILLGAGIGFLIFLALKTEWAIEALILGGFVSGLVTWAGLRRGMHSGLVSGILCTVIESSRYIHLFDIRLFDLGLILGFAMLFVLGSAITIVMVICGALGGALSSETAYYYIPRRGRRYG